MSTSTVPPVALDADALGSVDTVERAFQRLGHLVKSQVRMLAASVHPELKPAGWAVMGFALRCEMNGTPATVGDIVAATGMDKSVVSRQLHALKELGLVTQRRSAEDARVIIVEPTADARERFETVRAQQRAIYARALAGWSREDVAKLEELLTRLGDIDLD